MASGYYDRVFQKRELLVIYKGETSEKQKLTGGEPQGTLLGLFQF